MFDGLMVVLHVLCMFCCDIHIIKRVASCSQMVCFKHCIVCSALRVSWFEVLRFDGSLDASGFRA